MNARSHRVPPVVVAALVNIVLLVMGIVMGIAGLQATHDLAGPAPVPVAPGALGSSEDPPPLTPVLDPAPKEPRPVEQVVATPIPLPAATAAPDRPARHAGATEGRTAVATAAPDNARSLAAPATGAPLAMLASTNDDTSCVTAAVPCPVPAPALH